MMKKIVSVLLFGSLLGTFFLDISPASADNTDKNLAALSIKQAIENALAKNPMLEMVAAQANAAKNRTAQARSGFFPQVDLNGSWNRTTNPMWAFGTKLNQEKITQMDFAPDLLNNPDPINNFGADVSLRWALYNGGQIRTGRDQALLGEKIAVLGLVRARQQVIAQTATVYAGLLMAGENLNVIKQALKTAQTSLKMVQSRFNSGLAIKSDLLRAQVRIAKLAQLQTLAQSHVETA